MYGYDPKYFFISMVTMAVVSPFQFIKLFIILSTARGSVVIPHRCLFDRVNFSFPLIIVA